ERALAEGLELRRTDAADPIWLFGSGTAEPAFAPHLLMMPAEADPVRALHRRLDSLASLAQYGWMGGCVLGALGELGYERTLDEPLDMFFPGGQLIYEGFRSRPQDGRVHGSEMTNMFGPLARRRPDHPAVDLCLAMFDRRTQADGTILDGQTVAE